MSNRSGVFAAVLICLAGGAASVQAETLAGRVDKVDAAANEIVIDGVRYKLNRASREPGGNKPLLSRFQTGDGVIYTPGPGQTLLKIEKPAAGVDLPAFQKGGM